MEISFFFLEQASGKINMDIICTIMGEELFPLVYHQQDYSPFSLTCGYLCLTEDEVL